MAQRKNESSQIASNEVYSSNGGFEIFTAAELQNMDIPEVEYLIDGLLPYGMTLISGPSKCGKSWLILDICLSLAAGKHVLGYNTKQTDCLYLALEDNKQRLKQRLHKLTGNENAPKGLAFTTSAPSMTGGLFKHLDSYLDSHPSTKFVAIDTFQIIRPQQNGKVNAYAADTKDMHQLQQYADNRKIALLAVHHTRKMKSIDDSFQDINGSTGLMGAADTIIMLNKEHRDNDEATLQLTSRSIEAKAISIRFDGDTCRWENLGNADQLRQRRKQAEFSADPIAQTIKQLVTNGGGNWKGSSTDILTVCERLTGTRPQLTAIAVGKKLTNLKTDLEQFAGIRLESRSNGTAGKTHLFTRILQS